MGWKGIKHVSVGTDLKKSEWEAEEVHEIENGTSLPGSGNDGDFFYKTDEHALYIWKD